MRLPIQIALHSVQLSLLIKQIALLLNYFLSIGPGIVPNFPTFVSRFQLENKMADNNVHHWAKTNQLGKFLSQAVSAAGLQSDKRKLSNHSVRKTSNGGLRLFHANFPENYVM